MGCTNTQILSLHQKLFAGSSLHIRLVQCSHQQIAFSNTHSLAVEFPVLLLFWKKSNKHIIPLMVRVSLVLKKRLAALKLQECRGKNQQMKKDGLAWKRKAHIRFQTNKYRGQSRPT